MRASELWERASAELQTQMAAHQYAEWVKGLRPFDPEQDVAAGSQLVLVALNERQAAWFVRVAHLVGGVVGELAGGVVSLRVVSAEPAAAGSHGGQPVPVAPSGATTGGSPVPDLEAQLRAGVEVVDKRRGFAVIENVVIDEYLPLMGATVFAVYAYYVRLCNVQTSQAWPSYRTVCAKLKIGPGTLQAANAKLESLGLVRVIAGDAHTSNRYELLEVAEHAPGLGDRTGTAPASPTDVGVASIEAESGASIQKRKDDLPIDGASIQKRKDDLPIDGASIQKRKDDLPIDGASDQKRSASIQKQNNKQDKHVIDPVLLQELIGLGMAHRTAYDVLWTSPVDVVRGWLAYARDQRNLRNPAGFVLSRLQAGEEPP